MFRMIGVGMNHRFDSRSLLIAARQQPGTSRGTDGSRGMKIRKAHPLRREPVEFRCLEVGIPEAAEPGIPHVIDHYHDQIRPFAQGRLYQAQECQGSRGQIVCDGFHAGDQCVSRRGNFNRREPQPGSASRIRCRRRLTIALR
jgi:hypothetical protein